MAGWRPAPASSLEMWATNSNGLWWVETGGGQPQAACPPLQPHNPQWEMGSNSGQLFSMGAGVSGSSGGRGQQ